MSQLKVRLWVHCAAIEDGFKVEMWTSNVTGCTDVSDDLALADGVANRDMVRAEVRIASNEAAWVLNIYTVAIGGEPGCTNNGAALCCIDRITNRTSDVEAKVEIAKDTTDWVDAVAVIRGDVMAVGWPQEAVTDDNAAVAVATIGITC